MKTRDLPANDKNKDLQWGYAYYWTPIVLTMGWDGWSCNAAKIRKCLDIVPVFQWYIRIPNLKYRVDASLLKLTAICGGSTSPVDRSKTLWTISIQLTQA